MKTLKTVQTLCKLGKIFSTIVYVFCIVGFCCCAVGLLCCALGLKGIELEGKSLELILFENTGVTMGTLYVTIALAALVCAGQAVLAKFAQHYFKRELTDGTPFTLGGAKELQRLGILMICIPIGTSVICSIVYEIIAKLTAVADSVNIEIDSNIVLGAVFILMALICRAGTEMLANKNNADKDADESLPTE